MGKDNKEQSFLLKQTWIQFVYWIFKIQGLTHSVVLGRSYMGALPVAASSVEHAFLMFSSQVITVPAVDQNIVERKPCQFCQPSDSSCNPEPQRWGHLARVYTWVGQPACLRRSSFPQPHRILTTVLLLHIKLSPAAFKSWSFARTAFIKNLCGNFGLNYTWTES